MRGGFCECFNGCVSNQQFTSVSDINAITKKAFKTNSFWAFTFNIPIFKLKVVVADTTKTDSTATSADTSKASASKTTTPDNSKGK